MALRLIENFRAVFYTPFYTAPAGQQPAAGQRPGNFCEVVRRDPLETLQQTPVRATHTDAAAQSRREYVTSLVQMDSFEGKRRRAWYTVPKDPVPGSVNP